MESLSPPGRPLPDPAPRDRTPYLVERLDEDRPGAGLHHALRERVQALDPNGPALEREALELLAWQVLDDANRRRREAWNRVLVVYAGVGPGSEAYVAAVEAWRRAYAVWCDVWEVICELLGREPERPTDPPRDPAAIPPA